MKKNGYTKTYITEFSTKYQIFSRLFQIFQNTVKTGRTLLCTLLFGILILGGNCIVLAHNTDKYESPHHYHTDDKNHTDNKSHADCCHGNTTPCVTHCCYTKQSIKADLLQQKIKEQLNESMKYIQKLPSIPLYSFRHKYLKSKFSSPHKQKKLKYHAYKDLVKSIKSTI